MKDLVVEVPSMYADHHVLRVREALLATPGVTEVVAGAARRRVLIRFDETVTSPEVLRATLRAGGYPPDQSVSLGDFTERHKDGSTWHTVIQRSTVTERRDREMAGDFRRY